MSDHLALLAEALKDVDPAKLPHGLEQYKRFGPKTVRAILAVRDLVMHDARFASTLFRIGMTADPKTLEAKERDAGGVVFAIIHTSSDLVEVRSVEADVRLNFLWHFPGRCLNKGDYRTQDVEPGSVNHVYVVCYDDPSLKILGKV